MSKRKGLRTVARLLKTCCKSAWRQVIMSVLCAAVLAGVMIVTPALIGRCVDYLSAHDFARLKDTGLLMLVLFAASACAGYWQGFFAGVIAAKTAEGLRERLADKINALPAGVIEGGSRGAIVSAFVSDADRIYEGVQQIFTVFVSGIIVLIGSFAAMAMINHYIALMVAGVAPVALALSLLVSRKSSRMYKRQQGAIAAYSGYVLEIISSQNIVNLFEYQQASQIKAEEMAENLRDASQKAMFSASMVNPGTRFINNIAYVLIGLIGGLIAVSSPQAITAGTISALITYSAQFAKPLNEITAAASQFLAAAAAAERVFGMLDAESEADGELDAGVSQGEIEFKDVSFSYSQDVPLIEHLDLKVTKGMMVAIVGPTGAGKSTLVNLIMRFYRPVSGKILLDGVDINSYSGESLRKNIGMVLQDVRLFGGTVADNISFGADKDPERIQRAAEIAHCDTFIGQLSKGYETVIAEDSELVSQGQKQLITIARAAYKNAPILIFDEATSSVDSRTEMLIRGALRTLMQDKTSFVIAHRLSTVIGADLILYMRNGKIGEAGSHAELMAKKGFYYDMYMSQFDGGGEGAEIES